ncbi:MAG: hypothetical protein IPJ77_17935 [Planctomycetes bacterium]|nr:hypothetical protein [Planctomycetota bacterium]
MDSAHGSSRPLVFVLVALVAGAGGFAVGNALRRGEEPAPIAARTEAVTQRELEAVRDELLARLTPHALAPTDAEVRPATSLAGEPAHDARLEARLDALEARIALAERPRSPDRSVSVPEALRGSGAGSLDAIARRLRAYAEQHGDDLDGFGAELAAEHAFWRIEELLAAYGKPHGAQADDKAWILRYGPVELGAPTPAVTVLFYCVDGYLSEVFIEAEDD